MILYVPFKRNEAGDLPRLMEQWKNNHPLNSKQALRIIYHGDDFDFESDREFNSSREPWEIYVCAHGTNDNSFILGNNVNTLKSDYISIQTAAERFNFDFLQIASSITKIHLYCCGDQNKNRSMAHLFCADLLRAEVPIDTYGGFIHTPDLNGILWSTNGTTWTPVQNTVSTLSSPAVFFNENEHRIPLKSAEIKLSWDNSREKRRHNFFTPKNLDGISVKEVITSSKRGINFREHNTTELDVAIALN